MEAFLMLSDFFCISRFYAKFLIISFGFVFENWRRGTQVFCALYLRLI